MKVKRGRSQDTLDETADESMALIIPRMHLLMNISKKFHLLYIIIILYHLENPLHDFINITGTRGRFRNRERGGIKM